MYRSFKLKMMQSDKSLTTLFSAHSVFYKFIDTLSHKPYKIFYMGLIPKPVRRRLAEQAKLAQQNHIAGCWKQVISFYLNNLIEEMPVKPEKILTGRKIIWQY